MSIGVRPPRVCSRRLTIVDRRQVDGGAFQGALLQGMNRIVVMVILSGGKVFTDVRIRILPVKLADSHVRLGVIGL
jgi:hypothetical protein